MIVLICQRQWVCRAVGIGTRRFFQAGCRGFIGPVPLPLMIRYSIDWDSLSQRQDSVKEKMKGMIHFSFRFRSDFKNCEKTAETAFHLNHVYFNKGDSAPAGTGRGLSDRPLHSFGANLTMKFVVKENHLQKQVAEKA